MAKVFISYRHVDPDQKLAAALESHLRDRNVEVFVDTQIDVGFRWVEEIERQLGSAKFFVVLLSEDSIKSDMVRREIKMAHTLGQLGQLRILPIRVAFRGELPYDIGAYLDPIQYASWKPSDTFEKISNQIECAVLQGERLPGEAREVDRDPNPVGIKLLAEATEKAGAPLPVADPRLETGTLDPSSPFYIKRNEDSRIESFVNRDGDTLIIKAPRQFGKSSLMARARSLAEHKNLRTCLIDFQLIDQSQLSTLDALCRYLAHKLARAFRTSIKPNEIWDEHLGAKESLTMFIEDAILSDADSPVLLCLDEADRIFDREYCDDFFSAVRGWHNNRATQPFWKRFNLLIVHSTEPALWIRNLNISPFNVGERLRLPPFDVEHVSELNRRHGKPLKSQEEIEQLIKLVGGQPYLVRQAVFVLMANNWSFEQLRQSAINDRGPFSDHMRQHLVRLRRHKEGIQALQQALRKGSIDNEMDFERLVAVGLIRGPNRRSVTLACELYERYFEEHL